MITSRVMLSTSNLVYIYIHMYIGSGRMFVCAYYHTVMYYHDIFTHQGLSCNLLQELPSSFCELKSLQRVDLHRNELKDLPEGTLSPSLCLSCSLLSVAINL